MTHIRPVTVADSKDWLHMRCALWPEGSEAEHRDEIERFFAGQLRNPLQTLLALDDAGHRVGFVELSLRSYAEDCVTDRVAYLEGWYVVPEARRRGVGRALVHAAEAWAREQECAEFASDALLDNDASAAAHRALGFEETVQLRCFRKVVDPTKPLLNVEDVRIHSAEKGSDSRRSLGEVK
jgi:aminoglycoside 6'-N-acetyltransferase I